MKHREIFDSRYYLDESSPTGLRRYSDDAPAGVKARNSDAQSYSWQLTTRHKGKSYTWGLPFVLYELYNGVEPRRDQMIDYADGNKDNLSRYNLTLKNYNNTTPKILSKIAYDNFRNVMIPRYNPDYFNDPKDWTDPEALEALAEERRKRVCGESTFNYRKSRFDVWKPV
ncbi:hypothetical protein KXY27_004535 [Salmonella enterica]|nr:hypothetical protein [Salmonella enterica]EHU5767733.1 hypothetical protein [Salmonella enterica]